MSESYLIENTLIGTRTALLDHDGVPVEVNFFQPPSIDPTGCVMMGQVSRINKTLDMAFVSLTGGGNGALSFRRAKGHAQAQKKPTPKAIADCFNEGEKLIIQATGAPSSLEDKAIPLNTKVKIVGRYVVIETGKGRLNLSRDLPAHCIGGIKKGLSDLAENYAVVVRSRAQDVDVSVIVSEAKWIIKALENHTPGEKFVFALTPLEQALLNCPDDIETISIEGGENFASAKQICMERWPDLVDSLQLYKNTKSQFDYFGVEEAIEEALADKIELPCGGWVSVHETPALTAIDVNMGNALQGMSASEAKRIVNLEAALAVAFHLRFQNMGGLIVVDFIDNPAKGAVAEMINYLDDALAQDQVPVQRSGLSAFGLMQFNRRRRGTSLRQRFLTHKHPSQSIAFQATQLFRRAEKIAKSGQHGRLIITGPQAIGDWLKNRGDFLKELQKSSSRQIEFKNGNSCDCYLKTEAE